jgi:hypothetical protein
MSTPLVSSKAALALSAACLAVGCTIPRLDFSDEAVAAVRAQDLGTLPYHPVAYHLDLSSYAYHLHGQTLVWPFDPYYEEAGAGREALMQRVRVWLGDGQAREGVGLERYRGPGVLSGLPNNPEHDPILFQYSRLHPWSTTLNFPSERWIEYRTPSAITSRVREAYMCVRTEGSSQVDHESGVEGTVTLHPLPARREDAAADARDVLLVFEGGTGDKGETGQPASQSLMGFALLRATEGDAYDVHIAFRGSRSGSASRAAREALSSGNAGGNPDWITDLGYREVARPRVSSTPGHLVSRGMATSIASTLPQIVHCLDQVAGARARAPTHVYVTGHSLGGALAQHFASAVLLGDGYGPEGELMPTSLRGWPWAQLKLITFGAPRVGNAAWAQELTEGRLDSVFYRDQAAPFDGAAIGITGIDIVPRLTDPARPAAYRVLLPSDPITTDLIPGGAHVGHTVYLEEGDALNIVSHTDFRAHEVAVTRQLITDTLRDERIPDAGWTYHAVEEFVPTRDATAAGTLAEYEKLIDATRRYYADRDQFFDLDAFERGLEPFRALVAGE